MLQKILHRHMSTKNLYQACEQALRGTLAAGRQSAPEPGELAHRLIYL